MPFGKYGSERFQQHQTGRLDRGMQLRDVQFPDVEIPGGPSAKNKRLDTVPEHLVESLETLDEPVRRVPQVTARPLEQFPVAFPYLLLEQPVGKPLLCSASGNHEGVLDMCFRQP